MEEALGRNFTIRSAWDRLTQAEQLLRQANAALIPNVIWLPLKTADPCPSRENAPMPVNAARQFGGRLGGSLSG